MTFPARSKGRIVRTWLHVRRHRFLIFGELRRLLHEEEEPTSNKPDVKMLRTYTRVLESIGKIAVIDLDKTNATNAANTSGYRIALLAELHPPSEQLVLEMQSSLRDYDREVRQTTAVSQRALLQEQRGKPLEEVPVGKFDTLKDLQAKDPALLKKPGQAVLEARGRDNASLSSKNGMLRSRAVRARLLHLHLCQLAGMPQSEPSAEFDAVLAADGALGDDPGETPGFRPAFAAAAGSRLGLGFHEVGRIHVPS